MTRQSVNSVLRGKSVCVAVAAGAALALRAAVAAPEPAAEGFTPGPLLARMLDGPMRDVDEIVFAVRVPGHDHWYVTFGNYSDHSDQAKHGGFKFEDGVYWGYGEGGRLCRLNLRTGRLQVLLDDPKGGVRDPQLHYDGKKILFSYRRGGTHPFHLYELSVDPSTPLGASPSTPLGAGPSTPLGAGGTGLRQLTDGPDDDLEAAYCPDGSIVFCSSRCRRFVNCWYTRVATLYRCDADGANVRPLSSNNDHDNTPWLLPDGRVLYMRWEYVDRSQVDFHHLWTMNPDGTGQMVYFGNMHPGISMLDAKPVWGMDLVVASFSPGHGAPEHRGWVTIVNPARGPDEPASARRVSRDPVWKDPYAFGTNAFLVAHASGLHVMDGRGNAECFYALPPGERRRLECSEPRPLGPRPREHVMPDRTQPRQPTGTLLLQDIYAGRRMDGVARGAIDKLLVLKQLPKPVNFSGGMEPLTIGGSFTLAELVGTVPVAPDGSAHMELPALQSLFFVALDRDNRPVKRMHSFLTLQPGERTGCVGCHEPRTRGPDWHAGLPQAAQRPPARVQPLEGIPRVLDFPRDIQPVFDRHCLRCHSPEVYSGRVCLSGDRTGMYTLSYETLIGHGLVNDARNRPQGSFAPYSEGSAASRLMQKLDGAHHDVKVSGRDRDLLRLWIETSACYPGTYAALGHPSVFTALPAADMEARCGACHLRPHKDPKGQERQVLTFKGGTAEWPATLCNLTRPELSTVLRAPLAREAGGLALCKEVVFRDAQDPLYRKMLASAQAAHAQLEQVKRFDMPGFRPNEHYLREMQRFGFLPANLGPGDPVDAYAVDRAYWDSFAAGPAR